MKVYFYILLSSVYALNNELWYKLWQNQTIMKLFSLPIQWRTILKWKDFFKQSISFSKTFVDFQAKATERQIYISPFTFENNSDEVHITGCFGKRPRWTLWSIKTLIVPVGCHTPGKEIIQREFYLNIWLNNGAMQSIRNIFICKLLYIVLSPLATLPFKCFVPICGNSSKDSKISE